jgi:hypothetical protein
MQATGVINGHVPGCARASRERPRRTQAPRARAARAGRSGSR